MSLFRVGLPALATLMAVLAAPADEDLQSVTKPGAHIQRTMSLLASSTPARRNKVRVLFYGQSITAQPWWRDVANDLVTRFPHADLSIQNLAIGGYPAPELITSAEYDLYPFQPDLLIFHVYGGDDMDKFEDIIRRTRKRTAAEILLWTAHDNAVEHIYEQNERIRQVALKYRCGLVDVEAQWKKVLARTGEDVGAYLSDKVHLNQRGCALLASMIKPFLVHRPELLSLESRNLAIEIPMHGDKRVKKLEDGSLEVTFDGNRIDAIAMPGTPQRPLAGLTINGKKPSLMKELFALTRPSRTPYMWFPAAHTISFESLPVVEDWTLTFTESAPDASRFQYKVVGSVTGPDGSGRHDARFVSDSGRVVIEGGENWDRLRFSIRKQKGKGRMPPNFQVKWSVRPLFVEQVAFPPARRQGSERSVRLVQGLPNGKHVLRLQPLPGVDLNLKGFRIYRPPLR